MFTRRTIDEACSPSEKADSIKGWRRNRYAATDAIRHAAATQSLRKHLRRKRDLCMATLPSPLRREAPKGYRGAGFTDLTRQRAGLAALDLGLPFGSRSAQRTRC